MGIAMSWVQFHRIKMMYKYKIRCIELQKVLNMSIRVASRILDTTKETRAGGEVVEKLKNW